LVPANAVPAPIMLDNIVKATKTVFWYPVMARSPLSGQFVVKPVVVADRRLPYDLDCGIDPNLEETL